MSTTVDKISGDLQMRPELRKSFNLLKTHASKVASFTLQWQDLEEHFVSLDKSIQSKLNLLKQQQQQQQSNSKEPQLNPQPKSKETQLGSKEPQIATALQSLKTQVKKEEPLPESLTFEGVPISDGKELLVYLNARLKDRELVRELISNAVKASVDSAKLVLDAVRWFFAPENKQEMDFEVNIIRKSCVLLLEVLMKLRPVVKAEVSKEAMQLALDWKAKVEHETKNCIEVWGYLQLLGAFGLVGQFDSDEVMKLVGLVAERKQAPDLFRDLGFADRAPGFIQKLISENKQVDAVRFIHAFEQLNKFPPVPLLRAHLKFAKDAKMSYKKGQDLKAQHEAIDKEMVALRGIVRCIEEYKLDIEPQYSPETLRKRINELKRQKTKERVATLKAGGSGSQVQHLSGKKRAAPDYQGQPNKQNRNKHPRIAPVSGARNASYGAPATTHLIPASYLRQETMQPSYLRQAGLSESRGEEYFISSAGQAATPPNSYYGTISTFDSLRGSHQAGSFRGHGAEYAAGHDPIHESHNNLSSGSYALVDSYPGTRARQLNLTSRDHGLTSPSHVHMNSAMTSYGLGGSGRVTSHMSPLAARYGTSRAANGRSGQLGSTGSPQLVRDANPSPNNSIAYAYADLLRSGQLGLTGSPQLVRNTNPSPNNSIAYARTDLLRGRNYNDQPVSTSSVHSMPSQVPPSIYHL